jgi:hypothetical protein
VSVQFKDESSQMCFWSVEKGLRFFGFIVHENGVEIDPKKIESIKKVQVATCKKELQRFLGMVNYLRRFICNLSRKVMLLLLYFD